MDYRILGPLEILDRGNLVAVAEGRERTLLLLLLLQRSRPISVDAIVDALWPDEPPASAAKVVQNYVLRLRKALGHDVVTTVSGGYALRVNDDEVDATQAASLLVDGREALRRGLPVDAEQLLTESLALWRGEPLADVRYAGFAQAEIARLDELRLATVEERNDAELELGEHVLLVPGLEQQVRDHPLRERLRVQLMLALYRSGRQADALAAYQVAREALDERGLEPSRELRDLERAILNQDPELDAAPNRQTSERRVARHRKLVSLAAIAGVTLIGVAAAVYLSERGSEQPLSSLPADSIAEIDGNNGRVEHWFAVGKTPTAVAVTPSATWVTSFDDRTVVRIDLRSRRQSVVGAAATPTGIAAGREGVWVISSFDGTVERLDASGAGVLAVLHLRPGLADVATDPSGSVWITNTRAGTITKIDTSTNEVITNVRGFANPAGVAFGAGRVWVAETGANRVDALNEKTGRVVRRVPVRLQPAELAFGDGAVWVTNPRDSTVTRIDPYSGLQQIVSAGAVPSHVAVGGHRVWVTLDRDHSVVELDSKTGAVRQRLVLASPGQLNRGHTITPGGLAAAAGSAWVSIQSY